MEDLGEDRSISLRDAIGERDSAFTFSFFGLGVCGLIIERVGGSAVFTEPVEKLSADELFVMAARRPRSPGVFSKLVSPFRDGQELRPSLLTEFFNKGPLWQTLAVFIHRYSYVYAYDGDIDVAGVQTGPTPSGDWQLICELGLGREAAWCMRCTEGDGVEPWTTSTE
jgi:hypothetical protein